MNNNELRAEIIRHKMTVNQFVGIIGINKKTFYAKMSGKSEFKLSEIKNICRVLNLDNDKRDVIFFGAKVS